MKVFYETKEFKIMTRYHLQLHDILPIETTKVPQPPRMTRPQSENNTRNFNQPQVSHLTPQPTKSIHQKTQITYKRTWKLDQGKI